jgi:hypothetical protein
LWASGNAGERAALAGGQAGVGGAAWRGRRPVDGDEGVDLRVAGVDAGQALGGEFDGGDFPVAEGRGDVLEAGVDHGAWGYS